MSKDRNFFSFIHGGSLHIAPDAKVIPAKEFSSALDARDLLEKVKEDAKLYRKEVTAECEKLKEKAEKEGFEAGFAKWAAYIAELESEIKKVRSDVENMVFPVALKAAKKIVAKELEVSKKVIVSIISNALKAVAQHKNVVIYVNREDFALVEKEKEELAKLFESLESFSVVERADVSPGGCIIETEGGIINAQIENQWLILENAFEKLQMEAKTKKSADKEEKEAEKISKG